MDILTILLIIAGVNLSVLLLNGIFWILVSLGDRRVRQREQELMHKFSEVLENAHQEARDLLVGATLKSEQLVKNTEVMVEDIKQAMRRSFTVTSEAHQKLLAEKLQNLQTENQLFLDQLRNNLQSDAKGLLKILLDNLGKQLEDSFAQFKLQTLEARQNLDTQLANEYQQMLAEIKAYRDKRLVQVDDRIVEIVREVLKQIVKDLPIEVHENLVTQAFKQAKENQLFDSNVAVKAEQ